MLIHMAVRIIRLLRLRYRELGQLADQCLLTLKMEARCQCYYYVAIFLQKVCIWMHCKK